MHVPVHDFNCTQYSALSTVMQLVYFNCTQYSALSTDMQLLEFNCTQYSALSTVMQLLNFNCTPSSTLTATDGCSMQLLWFLLLLLLLLHDSGCQLSLQLSLLVQVVQVLL